MDTKDIIIYIVLPIVVAIISSMIIAFFKWIKPKIFKDYLLVKEIKKSTDADIESFIALYNRRIDENLRICAEQIVDFINKNSNDNIKHHLYVCKHLDQVVGFIKIIISNQNNYLFIAYIAIDNNDSIAVKEGVSSLIKCVIKKHLKRTSISQIFTEIERGANNGYMTPLYKHISRICKAQGMISYLIDFDYIQPNMPDDAYNSAQEDILSLIWIPKVAPEKNYIKKNDIITICKNIYEDIYLPSCKQSNCCPNYKKYLNTLYLKYKNEIPSKVKLISMTGGK